MTTGWSLFVLILTLANVAGAALLIRWSSSMSTGEGATTGHRWDGDIVEGNNPLPRWWLGLFWLTIIWGLVFFILYPSFGEDSLTGWTQAKQYSEEVAAAEEVYGELFAGFAATPLEELSRDPAALSAGRNLFVNNCAACHGSDGRGARGYPNLTDAEWLWGGTPDQILATIRGGRTGVMPPFGAALDEPTREALADYVLSLAGRDVPADRIEAGRAQYNIYCVACHGPTGDGNPLLGAPALANEIWLHGSSRSFILDVITNGRTSMMPPQAPIVGDDRAYVLAAYVLSLGRGN
jgi:cytochrome c oxidase cbb3-type subunit III